jgi:hypothetical protein
MAYRRSYDGMKLLNAWNIIVDLVLPFIFKSGRRLWDCRFHKQSLRKRELHTQDQSCQLGSSG